MFIINQLTIKYYINYLLLIYLNCNDKIKNIAFNYKCENIFRKQLEYKTYQSTFACYNVDRNENNLKTWHAYGGFENIILTYENTKDTSSYYILSCRYLTYLEV